ncbi:MAG TPA: methyltransferase domain-containing protein [Candidatus Limnocylindrales bacterium]|nr:methyltransferase domain-containing protein [Candidatus Limnocylindrales bacterium]
MANPQSPDWNSFGRTNASQKWRRQSAEMGSAMTKAIVEAAHVGPGMHVLDVASGSGEPAISIATQLAGTGQVIGVDVSPAPLQIASERAQQRGLANVRFQEADAHHLPFPDASFDRVTSRLGIMFFADVINALREMHRVLKPGGRATLLTWGVMGQPYFSSTIGTLLRVAQTGTIPEAARKMFAYGQPGLLARHLRSAGFEHAEEKFVTVEWTWPGTPEEVWDYFQEVTVPFAPLLQSIPAEKREEVDAAVVKAIGEYYDGTKVNFGAKINLTTATK